MAEVIWEVKIFIHCAFASLKVCDSVGKEVSTWGSIRHVFIIICHRCFIPLFVIKQFSWRPQIPHYHRDVRPGEVILCPSRGWEMIFMLSASSEHLKSTTWSYVPSLSSYTCVQYAQSNTISLSTGNYDVLEVTLSNIGMQSTESNKWTSFPWDVLPLTIQECGCPLPLEVCHGRVNKSAKGVISFWHQQRRQTLIPKRWSHPYRHRTDKQALKWSRSRHTSRHSLPLPVIWNVWRKWGTSFCGNKQIK